jgi:DNA polymerase (family 10)
MKRTEGPSVFPALVDLLSEIKTLLELKGENPFKIRAFDKAADKITELGDAEDWAARAKAGTLTDIPGIGKGISQVLSEYLLEGKSATREELIASLPEGLVELTKVPGLGPKKAMAVIEALGIKTIGELEHACRENRLLKMKGFSEKTQAKILEGVQFLQSTSGQLRLADAFPIAESLLHVLNFAANTGRDSGSTLRVSETGALRRRMETLSEFEFLVEIESGVSSSKMEEKLRAAMADANKIPVPLPVKLTFAETSRFGGELARTTAADPSWGKLASSAPGKKLVLDFDSEEKFFAALSLPVIPPEMRETGEEVDLARAGKMADVVGWNDLQGCFHNHTDRSDGIATLEEMVLGARARGMKYVGISDHSQSAFYAHGLKEPDLGNQATDLRALQKKYPDIRIFWGIESDILADGSLDYSDEVLKRFDFVVASIHSRFQMDRTTMTERILQAVRNPRTTMLGHLTGRLLLGRKGYDIEIERIIGECAERGVAIEINAHPNRLDIDWRYGRALREAGCFVSINPDAHEVEGFDDIKYGICVARKALLPKSLVVNTRDVAGVESWLKNRK